MVKASKFTQTIAKLSSLKFSVVSEAAPESSPLVSCTLKWRFQRLWVSPPRSAQSATLPALNDKQWFKDCLDRSTVHAIYLSPDLGEAALTVWADVCEQAKKSVFLRLPSSGVQKSYWAWGLKRYLDLTLAILFSLILSPVLLIVAVLIRLESSNPVLSREWRVGQQGKLFRVFKFCSPWCAIKEHAQETQPVSLYQETDEPSSTHIGYWIQKLGLDGLPQLLNVLRGEMSFVGTPALSLRDAACLPKQERVVLNALPGIFGFRQAIPRSHTLNSKSCSIQSCNILHLEYFYAWSLSKDLKIILSVLGNAFLNFGCKDKLNQKLQ